MFLSHIHNFRTIAIVFIVGNHSLWWLFDWGQSPFKLDVLNDIFANSTILFVFIAGYLFQLLSGKYNYKEYLKKKIKNVIFPFLIVSIPALIYSIFFVDLESKYTILENSGLVFKILWLYLNSGVHINAALWFIPMIAVYFIISPLFYLIIKKPCLYSILLILIPLSLLCHRPPVGPSVTLHFAIYFLSVYILGMLTSQYRLTIEPFLEKHIPFFLIAFFVLLIGGIFLSDHHGNYISASFFSFGNGIIDLSYIQKITLCFLLLGCLRKYDKLIPHSLSYLADYSFSIYFIHLYVFFSLSLLMNWRRFDGSVLLVIFSFILNIFICIIFTKVVKIIFGKYSRMVIGS
ncbi:MAG: surface polysaccharide O-acyltransferase-like enzyme [Desulforhopalus sp.]|jgi:surface polysaccharide O-acyltransferase-like enzyme